MVQKQVKPRGRPREYDPGEALRSAMDAFWDGGFSGTSMDALSARTGMNRPSLYAAFGDKEALYLKTVESYVRGRNAAVAGLLGAGRPLPAALREGYHRMIDFFLQGEGGARGCYLVSIASTEALVNPAVRKLMADAQQEIDQLFEDAFAAAQVRGEVAEHLDPRTLAILASAMMHTLALRARGGQPPAQLREMADRAVSELCAGGRAPVRPGARKKR